MVNYWRNSNLIFHNKVSKRIGSSRLFDSISVTPFVGDIVVGPINVLYPLGDFIVYSPIKGGSLQDILLETLLFTLMATIVITRYYSFKSKNEDIFLFRYHCKMDTFLYPVLILAIITSVFYVLNEFELSLVEVSIITILHSIAIFVIMLIWLTSRKTRQEHVISNL